MKKQLFSSLSLLVLGVAAASASALPKSTVQALIKSLQDPSVEVRTAAAQALADVPDDMAVKPLEAALIASPDGGEQGALVNALIAIDDPGTAKRLSEALNNPQYTWGAGAKPKAVQVVAKIGDKKSIRWLTDLLLSDQEPPVRAAAAKALGTIGAPPKKDEKK